MDHEFCYANADKACSPDTLYLWLECIKKYHPSVCYLTLVEASLPKRNKDTEWFFVYLQKNWTPIDVADGDANIENKVVFFVKIDVDYEVIKRSHSPFNVLAVEVVLDSIQNLILSIYIPPNSPSEKVLEVWKQVVEIISDTRFQEAVVSIVGVFNNSQMITKCNPINIFCINEQHGHRVTHTCANQVNATYMKKVSRNYGLQYPETRYH